MASRKIVVLGTGGTIAGRSADAADNVGYTAAQVSVAAILAGIPHLAHVPLLAEQVAQVDSKDMDFSVWRALAQRCAHWLARDDVTGIVVTHGTDTLEETAFFLQQVLAPTKPVVFTGAMRPATAIAPDGPLNLQNAIAVAGHPGAQGVSVAFAGKVHAPADVTKVHPYALDAFGSGDAGPLGYVEEGVLRLVRPWPAVPLDAPAWMACIAGSDDWPRVEIVTSHAGADGRIVRALVADGVRGIVVVGTGNGTVHHRLLAALQDAVQAGVRVVRATRCAQGRIVPHAGDTLPHSAGLSPVKARIALMLELMR